MGIHHKDKLASAGLLENKVGLDMYKVFYGPWTGSGMEGTEPSAPSKGDMRRVRWADDNGGELADW